MTTGMYTIHPKIETFLKEPIPLFIDGEWRASLDNTLFESENPATGEVLAQVHQASKEDVNDAVEAAVAAFESGVWPSMQEK